MAERGYAPKDERAGAPGRYDGDLRRLRPGAGRLSGCTTVTLAHVRATLERIRADGFYKTERVIASPQSPAITLADGERVLNFCANNYLGLANDPRLIDAARDGLARHGFGMASVRFICGTQDVHKELEAALAAFLGTDDSILYSSCFDANGGLFETLLGEEDAVISDELNHASIIDGIRLCKAKRFRYRNNDMADLEAQARTRPTPPAPASS